MVDIAIVGAGHNGLVAATFLARHGLRVEVFEAKDVVGGACRTEYPFAKLPRLGCSTGAYLLGLMPPELVRKLGIDPPLVRRDPHYFLPTKDHRYLLFGSNEEALRDQFCRFFSESDYRAHKAMNRELAMLREDIAPTWLQEPESIEETAEHFVRPPLRGVFVDLCRKPIADYLGRFAFQSDLLRAMYAVTDAFSGLTGGLHTPGTGMNFLVHNMCRLPGSDGTFMIVKGGMGTVTRMLADAAKQAGATIRTGTDISRIEVERGSATGVVTQRGELIRARAVLCNADPFRMRELVERTAFPGSYHTFLDARVREGTTMKVNLALRGLPKFRCLPEDKGQYGPTIHLLPDEHDVLASLERAFRDATSGKLPEFPTLEWYLHTTLDPSLQDPKGHHNAALFVQWVPYRLSESTWERETEGYVKHLLSICDAFAPGTSDLVEDVFALPPPAIEQHFGIRYGHIHHIDNAFGFADRHPYRTPLSGLYSASAGCHPAGSVIGAAGHNAAMRVLSDLGLSSAV